MQEVTKYHKMPSFLSDFDSCFGMFLIHTDLFFHFPSNGYVFLEAQSGNDSYVLETKNKLNTRIPVLSSWFMRISIAMAGKHGLIPQTWIEWDGPCWSRMNATIHPKASHLIGPRIGCKKIPTRNIKKCVHLRSKSQLELIIL